MTETKRNLKVYATAIIVICISGFCAAASFPAQLVSYGIETGVKTDIQKIQLMKNIVFGDI